MPGSNIVGIKCVVMLILGGLGIWMGCRIAMEYIRSRWLALKLRVLLYVLTQQKNLEEILIGILVHNIYIL